MSFCSSASPRSCSRRSRRQGFSPCSQSPGMSSLWKQFSSKTAHLGTGGAPSGQLWMPCEPLSVSA
eukprot:7632874-Pyramimonas_sp.AAC.1